MPQTDRCPYRARHWRIMPAVVGLKAPVCTSCGSPSPKPLTKQEWDEAIDWHYLSGYARNKHVQAAIEREADEGAIYCRDHVVDLRARDLSSHVRCHLAWREVSDRASRLQES